MIPNQRILQYCRYFHYESRCPYPTESDEALFWHFEAEYYLTKFDNRKYWENDEVEWTIHAYPELKNTILSLPTTSRGMIVFSIASLLHMSPMGANLTIPRFKNYNPNISEEELFRELKKKDLIHRCRYYHGEEVSDNPENSLWWQYEKKWVELNINHKWSHIKENMRLLVEKGYARLMPLDGTPAALKGILLSQFHKWRSGDYKYAIGYEEDYLKVDSRNSEEWYNESQHKYLLTTNLWKEYDWLRRQDLIAQCRYYRDGEECPQELNEFWWNTEKLWVEMNYSQQYAELDENLRLYISCGLGDYRSTDKTPSTLKALFWRKQYTKTDPKMLSLAFKIIYERDYLNIYERHESPTLDDFRKHADDIPSFALKYRTFFENGYDEDGYFFLACSDFYQEALDLGFELDFGESLNRVQSKVIESEDPLSINLNTTDVKALGNAIITQWRMHSRGGYSTEELWMRRGIFIQAFHRLFELSAKENEDLFKLTWDYLSDMATNIPSFAQKYIHFFEYGSGVDRYKFDDELTFSDECFSFGFDMDSMDSYQRMYESDPANAKMSDEEFIHTLTDIKLIGTALHSQWRYYNHWAGPGSILWDSREWFLLMFQRLLELSDKPNKTLN